MGILKTASAILETMLNAKGQYVTARWKSIVKTSAQYSDLNIEKITSAVVRAGIDFANLSSVKEGIENGERGEVKPLKWGSWKQFPYIIEHTKKSGEYNEYVRLYPSNSPNHIPSVSYFVDGVKTTKNEIMEYLTPSDAKKLTSGEKPECFTLTSTNILDIVEM